MTEAHDEPAANPTSAEIENLNLELAALREELRSLHAQLGWLPGHFYSPYPFLEDVRRRESEIFDQIPSQLPGIDLNDRRQIEMLHMLAPFYAAQPFTVEQQSGQRYKIENPNFGHGEAITLYSMIRYAQPTRIIEIGAGFSSAAILDVNELFFNDGIECTFIEPYPQLLHSLLSAGDESRINILAQPIQAVDLTLFDTLEARDILFVDSSHVAKVNSDVNHIFFEILPRLKEGVFVHFHDIGYPFEYPKEWIYEGRAWNEAYMLRAFLQFNEAFQIQFFNAYLSQFHAQLLQECMPLCSRNPGTSLWLLK